MQYSKSEKQKTFLNKRILSFMLMLAMMLSVVVPFSKGKPLKTQYSLIRWQGTISNWIR